ncbi:MAG TPA: hypothetical protein VD927_19075 [Chryseosolibacter sp.]|nr:hypothetical protein [Chryseosolibacter sp.]
MKFIIVLLMLSIPTGVNAQQHNSSFELENDVSLTAITETFHAKEHKFDTCRTNDGRKICLIDGELFFGIEGVHAPRYELKHLSITLNGTDIPLETSGMYNPNLHHPDVRKAQFKFEKTDPGYLLTGFFSDGLATYVAQWLIVRQSALRIKLSSNENDIDEE